MNAHANLVYIAGSRRIRFGTASLEGGPIVSKETFVEFDAALICTGILVGAAFVIGAFVPSNILRSQLLLIPAQGRCQLSQHPKKGTTK